MGLAISKFIDMLDSITSTELVEYILYSSVECNDLKIIHEEFPGVSDFLNVSSYAAMRNISNRITLQKGERTSSFIVQGRISSSK